MSKTKRESASAEGAFVVDSSFLDRLVEQDFKAEKTPSPDPDSKQREGLLAERRRLQSMKEELENEKREWQHKQVRALSNGSQFGCRPCSRVQ